MDKSPAHIYKSYAPRQHTFINCITHQRCNLKKRFCRLLSGIGNKILQAFILYQWGQQVPLMYPICSSSSTNIG